MNSIVRYDTDNKYNWDTIEEYYDVDVLIAKITNYDDGTIKEEQWAGGIRTQTSQYDNPGSGTDGVKTWDSIDSYFDFSGQLEARVTQYDNGVIREEQFQDGIRTQTSQYDNPGSGSDGAKNWDTIDIYFDQSGVMEARVTHYDNGVIREEQFQDGVRSQTTQYDNPGTGSDGVKSWDQIQTFYETDGTIAAKVTTNDNGTINEVLYQNGVKEVLNQYDNPGAGSPGAKIWDSVHTYYNEDGTKAARVTNYDDGREKEELWNEGVREATILRDNPNTGGDGAYSYSEIATFFDFNGDKAARVATYDNGDATQHLYDMGDLSQYMQFDGDGSEDWTGRVTNYAEDGSVLSVETYETIGDLPPEFGFATYDMF